MTSKDSNKDDRLDWLEFVDLVFERPEDFGVERPSRRFSMSGEAKIVKEGELYKYNPSINIFNPKWSRYFKIYDDGLVEYFSDK